MLTKVNVSYTVLLFFLLADSASRRQFSNRRLFSKLSVTRLIYGCDEVFDAIANAPVIISA